MLKRFIQVLIVSFAICISLTFFSCGDFQNINMNFSIKAPQDLTYDPSSPNDYYSMFAIASKTAAEKSGEVQPTGFTYELYDTGSRMDYLEYQKIDIFPEISLEDKFLILKDLIESQPDVYSVYAIKDLQP